jgi:hypothetical protein
MTTMSTPPADSASLEERLSALEAENRDLQWRVSQLRFLAAMLGVGLLAYAAFHAAFATPIKATVVEAQRVVLRDPAGRVRLVLGTDDGLPEAFRARDNPGLLLCDEKGALRVHLHASAASRMARETAARCYSGWGGLAKWWAATRGG